MLVLDQQINQMLDQVGEYGWGKAIDVASSAEAQATEEGKRKELHAFLELFTTRLKNMQRPFNRVYYRPSDAVPGSGIFKVMNYTFAMYIWYLNHGFPKEVITPESLGILEEWLTPEEVISFKKRAMANI